MAPVGRNATPHGNAASGFTLIEVAVAFAILSLVLFTFIGSRSDVIADAAEARSWRLARNIAGEVLSELQAGARETPPTGRRVPVEGFEGFAYQILIGEAAISENESSSMSNADDSADPDGTRGERLGNLGAARDDDHARWAR